MNSPNTTVPQTPSPTSSPGFILRMLRLVIARTLSLFPPAVPYFTYTVLLRWRPLRTITNTLLRAMIPSSISIPEGTIILNPNDSVVSGALMLGVHEPTFRRFFTEAIAPGMTVLDIGANIGYYTLIASNRVGPSGMVVAFEPEQANGSILHRMIEVNRLQNVHVSRVAIGAEDREAILYLHPDNKGKHTLLPAKGSSYTTVHVQTLQSALSVFPDRHIDLIKMDIEGWEGKAFLGMWEIITHDRPELFFEFAPVRIQETGENPLAILARLRELGYALSELDDRERTEVSIDDFEVFTLRFSDFDAYADIHAKPTKRTLP